jgi:hypothetical protein
LGNRERKILTKFGAVPSKPKEVISELGEEMLEFSLLGAPPSQATNGPEVGKVLDVADQVLPSDRVDSRNLNTRTMPASTKGNTRKPENELLMSWPFG